MIPSTLIRVFARFLSYYSTFNTSLLSCCFPRCVRDKELLFFIIVCYVFLTLFWFHHMFQSMYLLRHILHFTCRTMAIIHFVSCISRQVRLHI
ncbi:hypothetical protein EDD85DRAFT_808573 [Armillaria nabsnona]|nr:hypothetical protein EDD85DRAFT_808573 [Armillaria nabsnona]